jgi:CDP-glucose 4,6-dehydratase
MPIAIARAGNVIGGGDVGIDRLVPDLLTSFSRGEAALVRNPSHVRPWQHVLDCLSGYLLLADEIQKSNVRGAWNFGPAPDSYQSVDGVADKLAALWGGTAAWVQGPTSTDLVEASFLTLDSSKARSHLAWSDRFTLDQALEDTVSWQKSILGMQPGRSAMDKSIERHAALI